jgi:hypothetical protein
MPASAAAPDLPIDRGPPFGSPASSGAVAPADLGRSAPQVEAPASPEPSPAAEAPVVAPPAVPDALPGSSATDTSVDLPELPREPGMSDGELAWLADAAAAPAPSAPPAVPAAPAAPGLPDIWEDLADPASTGSPARPEPDPPPALDSLASEPPTSAGRAPGLPRLALAAAVLIAAGGAAFAVWRWQSAQPAEGIPAPPRAAVPATPQPAAPAPDLPPEPPAVAPPAADDAAALAALAPPTAPEPKPAAPPRQGTRFEPGGERRDDRSRSRDLRIARSDRKLLDLLGRKDDVAQPAAPVEKLALDTGRGSLDRAAVERIVEGNGGAFSSCVTRAVKGGAPLPADRRATLLLTVKPDGAVASAWIAEAEIDGAPLGRCLRAAALRMVFPAFDGAPMEVSVPLALSAVH